MRLKKDYWAVAYNPESSFGERRRLSLDVTEAAAKKPVRKRIEPFGDDPNLETDEAGDHAVYSGYRDQDA